MPWQILLFINLIAGSAREFLTKKIVGLIDPLVMDFYLILINTVLLYLIQFFYIGAWPGYDFWLSATGALYVIAFLAYLYAIRISLSQSILFQSYSILVTIFFAMLFLGEGRYMDLSTMTGVKVLLGMFMAVTSLWFLLGKSGMKKQKMEKKWVIYISITVFFMGIGSFLSILFLKRFTPLEILINQSILMVPFIYILVLLGKKSLKVDSKMMCYIGVDSVVSIVAVIAYLLVLKTESVTKFIPMQQVTLVILTMILGVVFYKEKSIFTPKKSLGMFIGLLGVLLLSSI